jgi:ubiquinone biosynthesis protein UbiJ
MRWPDPAHGSASIANRVLADQEWARDKLASTAGRIFTVAVGPVSATWSITPDGRLASAPAGVTPDLRLTLSPFSLPAFLADPARWNDLVREEGDAELASVLKDIARTMPWFVEETFAKALGPVAGQRAADAGRRLLAFPEYAADRLAQSTGSYVRDEAGLLARGGELRKLRQGIEEVTVRVDALAQRIEALTPRIRPIRPS